MAYNKAFEVEAMFPLPENEMRPGHGILAVRSMITNEGDRVLDLGTGPIAFFAIIAARRGAQETVALEINDAFIRSAQQAVDFNKLQNKIKIIKGPS
jgi:ribosomal protein L11 methylase PrmA